MIIISLKNLLQEYDIFDDDVKYININGNQTTYICDINGNIYNTRRKGNGYNKKTFKKLRPITLPNGYLVVSLSINGVVTRYYIHRIIAISFIPLPDKYISKGLTFEDLEVNHKDGDKTNNHITNLEWCTSSENKIHAYKTNLSKQCEDSCKAIFTNAQVHAVCKYLEENKLGPTEISRLTGVSIGQIHEIKNKNSWTKISSMYDFSNYTPKQKKYTDQQLSKMYDLLANSNMSISEISKITGIKEKSIYVYRQKMMK